MPSNLRTPALGNWICLLETKGLIKKRTADVSFTGSASFHVRKHTESPTPT